LRRGLRFDVRSLETSPVADCHRRPAVTLSREAERKPFPKMQTLGERLKLSPRQARPYVAELEAAGLVTRIERRAAHRGKLSNEYDLSGLVKRLQQLEPEFREVEEENRARRRAVARPGYPVSDESHLMTSSRHTAT